MNSTLKTVRPQVGEFDDDLVRILIKIIKVNKEDRLGIQFELGILMEQMLENYD